MVFMFLAFIFGFGSFLTLGFFYLKKRLIHLLPIQPKYKKRLTIFLFFTIYSAMLMIFLRLMENRFSDFMYWYAYISLGFANILVSLTVIRDLVLIVSALVRKVKVRFLSSSPARQPAGDALRSEYMNRRDFFVQASGKAILSLASGLSAYAIYEARKLAHSVPVSVSLKNLPKSFDGFKITQITDIHIGPTIKKGYMEAIVEAVNKTKPDMVAITGDLVDGSVERLYEHVEPLKYIQSRYGSYFVTGNHEYYSGAENWVKAVQSLGIQTLINEHVTFTRGESHLILAGVTDYTAHRMLLEHKTDPAKAIQDCKVEGCKILLAHQPRSIYKASQAGFDLQISGHTHGGQIFPWNFLVHLVQPFVEGLHLYKNTWIYVNRGAGYWGIPMRLGAPSEIAEITLHSI